MKTNCEALVITATAYEKNDGVRRRLAERLIRETITAGYPILIMDKSPDPDGAGVRESFVSLGAKVVHSQANNYPEQKREMGVYGATVATEINAAIILFCEPEKCGLVPFIPEIIKPIQSKKAQVVIPSRSERSWKTFPNFQRMAEQTGNLVFQAITHIRDADPFFGPVAYSLKASPFFETADAQPYGFPNNPYFTGLGAIKAKAAGMAVEAVSVDFEYPPEQKIQEEGPMFVGMVDKRLSQQAMQVGTWLAASRVKKCP